MSALFIRWRVSSLRQQLTYSSLSLVRWKVSSLRQQLALSVKQQARVARTANSPSRDSGALCAWVRETRE